MSLDSRIKRSRLEVSQRRYLGSLAYCCVLVGSTISSSRRTGQENPRLFAATTTCADEAIGWFVWVRTKTPPPLLLSESGWPSGSSSVRRGSNPRDPPNRARFHGNSYHRHFSINKSWVANKLTPHQGKARAHDLQYISMANTRRPRSASGFGNQSTPSDGAAGSSQPFLFVLRRHPHLPLPPIDHSNSVRIRSARHVSSSPAASRTTRSFAPFYSQHGAPRNLVQA